MQTTVDVHAIVTNLLSKLDAQLAISGKAERRAEDVLVVSELVDTASMLSIEIADDTSEAVRAHSATLAAAVAAAREEISHAGRVMGTSSAINIMLDVRSPVNKLAAMI